MNKPTPTDGDGLVPRSIRVNAGIWDRLDRVARASHRSRQDHVRYLLERAVLEHEEAA